MNRLAVATFPFTALALCAWDGPIAPPLPPPPPFPSAPVPPAMADPAPTKASVAPASPTLSSAILDDVVTVVERAKAAKPSRDDDPALFAGLALKASEFPAIRDEIALAQHAIHSSGNSSRDARNSNRACPP